MKAKFNLLPLALLLVMVFSSGFSAFAADFKASGTVTDKSDEPLIGVTVGVKGNPGVGTVTDIDGGFTLQVPQGSTLVFSYVGCITKELAAAADMKVVLDDDSENLEEVVVIGYGTVKRKDLTTAVSTVGGKDIDNRPIISAAQALQGKAAGIAVSSPNGAPGGGMTIRVRGTTSMNGSNDPLYVVDGVPVDNISFLAPNDIESMQILKDASATAIYGSRGANGVILISTKHASSGKAQVSLNIQGGFTRVVKKIDVLNYMQYKELQDEIGLVAVPDGLSDMTDWQDETFRTGSTQNYNVSISQATEKLKYFFSGGYQRDGGIIKASFYQRYNFRMNVESELYKWLTAKTNVSYSDYSSNGGGAMGTGSSRGGVILSTINTPTYAPIWDPEKPEQYYNNFYGVNLQHPVENIARQKYNRDRENRIIASGELLFTFIPGLTLQSKFTLDRRNALNTTFLDPVTTTRGREQYGEGSDNRNQNTVLTWDNILNWKHEFGKHGLDIMAGSSWTDSDYRNSYISGSHYRDDKIQTLNAANKIGLGGAGSAASEWAIMSYLGRVAYNYDSRYLLTANIRYDGSSKLHPDHRWKAFPSVSAAWRVNQESFMENINWISDLKLRGGWGKTGNQGGIGDYAYLQRYNINRVPWYEEGKENAVPTITQANLRTTDLTWETTTQWGIGVDFSVLNSRLNLAADYYYKKTTDMLMWVSLPINCCRCKAQSSVTKARWSTKVSSSQSRHTTSRVISLGTQSSTCRSTATNSPSSHSRRYIQMPRRLSTSTRTLYATSRDVRSADSTAT